MSTISASTTSTTAYKVTADTTGTLVFQTGASPTTAMSISSSQIISFTNPPTATGGGSLSTNTAYGTSALAGSNSGSGNNTGIGYQALAANTTGTSNVGVGYQALLATTTAQGLTAVGAGAICGSNTGSYNNAFGTSVLAANTSGTENNGFGFWALLSNTTGIDNCAFGEEALRANINGSNNTAYGAYALRFNTSSNNNVAVGHQAGYSNTTMGGNVFIGYQAGYLSNRTATDGYNVIVGFQAGYNLSTGYRNTFIGTGAGAQVTSGYNNTIVGEYNGNQGGLNISTANNYIVLSDGDGNPRGWWDNSGIFYANPTRMRINGNSLYDVGNGAGITFGAGIIPADGTGAAVDNSKSCGTSAFRFTIVYATTGTINTSDANQKQDIASLDDAEKRVATAIKSLIKKYRFRDAVAEKGDAARIHVGAVAQEVQAAFVAEGLDPARYALFCSDTWYEVDGKASVDEPYTAETEGAVEVTRLGLRYDELLAFVIAAM